MKEQPLYFYALDPTHIGAGGYRLGRVDLTVLRDAATGLPKLPGSSINGAVRSAALYSLPDEDRAKAMAYADATQEGQNKPRPHEGGDDPVARIFGYAEGAEKGQSRIGAVAFHDADILAFPVPTMAGPRWVTTPERLEAAGCVDVPPLADPTRVLAQRGVNTPQRLNLGWLLLDAEGAELPFPAALVEQPGMKHVHNNLVLAHADIFPSLVNANLETRTSVSIDFATGAAAENLLFTYEATPRGTLYRGLVSFDDKRFPALYPQAQALVRQAVDLASRLGFGAMTTRGFGRMQAMWEGLQDA